MMPNFKQRTIRIFLTLLVIIILNFVIPRAMPGDPMIYLLGEDASVDQETLNNLKRELGLDKPVSVQFLYYCRDLLRMDFGYSYHFRKKVTSIIIDRIPWTLGLLLPSIFFGALLGIFLGARSAWTSPNRLNRLLTHALILLYSIPAFFLAMMVLNIFSIQLNIFPMKGFYQSGSFQDILLHYLLPVMVLSLISLARNFLIMRGSVILEKDQPYVIYARAKGLSAAQILNRHVFKNAILPLIALIALDFGFLFSGALFIEIVFSLNGMGTLIYDSILSRDYPLIQGIFLTITFMVIAANLIAEGLQLMLDPRTRKPK
jgi:peptide/nickel transport system permease protein